MPISRHLGLRPLLFVAMFAATLPVLAASRVAPAAPAVLRVDPLVASLAAEFALQGGQLPEAARQYLSLIHI